MTLPFAIGTVPVPDWMPWWMPAVLLIPVLLYGLLALLVPFSVFGLKGRLDSIEAQLEDIHAEIRTLSLRLPPAIGEDFPRTREASRPPIPPVAYYPQAAEAESEQERVRLVSPARAPRPDSRPAPRAEPRFGPR